MSSGKHIISTTLCLYAISVMYTAQYQRQPEAATDNGISQTFCCLTRHVANNANFGFAKDNQRQNSSPAEREIKLYANYYKQVWVIFEIEISLICGVDFQEAALSRSPGTRPGRRGNVDPTKVLKSTPFCRIIVRYASSWR